MLQFRVECLLGPWSICVWILSVHNSAYSDYCAAPRPWCGLVSRGPIPRNVQHLPPPLQRTGRGDVVWCTSSSRVTVWSFNFGKCQMLFLKYGLDVNIISGRVVPQIKPKRKPRCIRSMKRKRNFIELWRLRSMLTDLLFSLRCDTFWFSFCLVIGTSVEVVQCRVLTAGGREVAAEDVYGGLAAAAVQQQEQQRVHEGVHEGDVESNLHTNLVTIIYNSNAMLQQY